MRKILCLCIVIFTVAPRGYASFTPALKDTTAVTRQYDSIIIPGPGLIKAYISSLSFREKLRLYSHLKKIARNNNDDGSFAKHANRKAVLGYFFTLAGILVFYFFIPGFFLSKKALKMEAERPGVLTAENLRYATFSKKFSVAGFITMLCLAIVTIMLISTMAVSCR